MTETASKYHAQPAVVDGIHFDSQAEARRYQELLLLLRAGQILALMTHPRYIVAEAFIGRDGKKRRAIYYEGDFMYQENGQTVVEDVKGYRGTRVWELKRKLFEARYPEIDLRVVQG